ncbi:MAG: phosphoribosyl-AMP cyclohydrolase [Planctomycetota bacterium]|nr:MAG: phosphoribosyl-AMP cyclohydrolase [Planctomycetota bacterium]
MILNIHNGKHPVEAPFRAQLRARTHTVEAQLILEAQRAWGNGIVKIGKVFLDKGDYRAAAEEHINEFYNYQAGTVLFKPTLCSEKQFRLDFEGALSYFVGGNSNYPEDNGFAIRPWSDVQWDNIGTKIIGNMGVAMGNYFFTPAEGGDAVKVEYSFAYTINEEGQLKIVLHDSHLPYSP